MLDVVTFHAIAQMVSVRRAISDIWIECFLRVPPAKAALVNPSPTAFCVELR